ncbi:hypothetical protein LTR49_011416 [Elasticomyces elasticus]|nr:hypothetical protein LTR49_011416 [Elasticomyces elasticus]
MLTQLQIVLLLVVASAFATPTVTVLNGTYSGINVPFLKQDIFRGMPFAQQSRFEQATPMTETWKGTRDATQPGVTCAGFGTNPREHWLVGEDCLNLNVVRPEGSYPGLDLPVLRHGRSDAKQSVNSGGGFRQGSNRDPEFNSSFMVQTSQEIAHPLITVEINYRVSAFGFAASTELGGSGALNIGLQDQRHALRWIHENIRAFGGDPNKVTIWGESAGAQSVALQLMAYGGDTQGLFRSAIMASGSFFGFGQHRLADAQLVYNNMTNATGCADAVDTLQCLKELPFSVINATAYGQNEGQAFGPVVDGDFFRTYPFKAFEQGRLPPVNIITGCNSDEGLTWASVFGNGIAANTTAELAAVLEVGLHMNGTLADQLLDLYPFNAPAPPYSVPLDYQWVSTMAKIGLSAGAQTRRLYGLAGDKAVMAGRRKTASEWDKFGGLAYSFRFDTDSSRFPIVVTPGLGPGFAQHGAELSWQFRLPYIAPTPYPPLPNITSMRDLSYAMQATWASFAATGSPNHHGVSWVPYWPAYSNGSQNMVFNATLSDSLNLHVEDDDFRRQGIAWMNDKWALLDK